MPDIVIMEKPESVSYEEIHEVLYRAHESNRQKGFVVRTALMTGEQLEKHIGPNGKCFVAMDGDKVVGTVSYRIKKCSLWCVKGPAVDRILVGVLPEYKGMHIATKLFTAVYDAAIAGKYKWIISGTQDQNTLMQEICLKDGFMKVDFSSVKPDHYAVIMVKWLGKCPYTSTMISIMYMAKKAYVKLRYKPGHVKRFGI
ncbi:MAG: GNAT family N-acetyltransferase [Clostridia bacterium]|nr:GNAT family N-acetyltransferase [Clostridia bacterium]